MNIRFDYESLALPERYRGEPGVDIDQCISCGLCVAICPNKALERVEVLKEYQHTHPYIYPKINIRKCCFCALCQDICPVGAIRLTKNILLATSEPSELIKKPVPKYVD